MPMHFTKGVIVCFERGALLNYPARAGKRAKVFQVPFEFREKDLIVSLGAPNSVSVLLSALPLLYVRIL